MPRGILSLCCHVTVITDLTSTLRYDVALHYHLDVIICYCVTVGAEIVLT